MAVEVQEFPTISDEPEVQSLYEECRRQGSSHRLAEMLACRQGPSLCTEREMYRHVGTLADQFDGEEHNLQLLAAKAKARGREVNYTDIYNPAIAKEPLDPEALVPRGQAKSYIRKRCLENDWECHGSVEVKRSFRDFEKNVKSIPRVNPEIVEREVAAQIAADPGLAPKKEQLKQEFIDKHGPKKPYTPPGA